MMLVLTLALLGLSLIVLAFLVLPRENKGGQHSWPYEHRTVSPSSGRRKQRKWKNPV